MARCNTVVSLAELDGMVKNWLNDSICQQHSEQTLASKRLITDKLRWWMVQQGYASIGVSELREFLAYVGGPAPNGGRWGKPNETQRNRPRTVKTYWERLRTLFRWAVNEGLLTESPMQTMKAPTARGDQIQPLSEQQVRNLIMAAGKSRRPLRDVAILLFLVDTGVRASELCALKMTNLDMENGKATVLGKGNKRRPVFFNETTAEALQGYLQQTSRDQNDFVFHGKRRGSLTRSGLQQLIQRLGKSAGVTGLRCSPHTFRHTHAIWAIRNGMNTFSLQSLLGHTDLSMTRRYVAIAQADVEEQHRLYSPVSRLTAAFTAA